MHASACKNRMTIIGPKDVIQSFKDSVATDDSVLSVSKLLPVPEELLTPNENIITPSFLEKYGAIDAMTWKDDNWGVYKDFEDAKIIGDVSYDVDELEQVPDKVKEYGDRILVYSYTTTCIPPLPSYREFSTKFPELTFHLSFDVEVKGHHSTCGFLLVKAGKMLRKWFMPLSFDAFKAQMMDEESPITRILELDENEKLNDTEEEDNE